MLIKNIETKIKLSLLVSLGSFLSAIIIVVVTLAYTFRMLEETKKKIYVLDHGVPVLVHRTGRDVNRLVEYQSHINMFHLLFFTLPPDDDFMQHNIAKAMYLIDKSGLIEYNNLKEKGYYSAILASSAVLSIRTDSILVDTEDRTFRYYGTQRIERKTRILTRKLVTAGSFMDVPRSANNPHGCLITSWRTVLNIDLSDVQKKPL